MNLKFTEAPLRGTQDVNARMFGLFSRTGLWTKMVKDGQEAQVVMSLETLAQNPAAVSKHARMMHDSARLARPNAAHDAIARLKKRLDRVCVLTQNIDRLHRKAGSTNIIEIHGELDT